MDSIGNECVSLKKEYDECFNNWYAEKFLKGHYKDSCAELLEKYSACVWKAVKEKNIKIDDVTMKILSTDKEQKIPESVDRNDSGATSED
ncbi:TP53-regulated inhibitor of apoptosis 1-B [Trichoplax sp. H2]|nr:TP53-regulated inhibitor of apoptosis 1-B [Trichoplax sp. H2]|eukprot:RDD40712.1 TP53-regulated inhibitor of apoptosis 1-B [Trichoplax sp. H2]